MQVEFILADRRTHCVNKQIGVINTVALVFVLQP
jgi:hypothetical protein